MSKLKIIFFCIGSIFATTCCFNRVYADESSNNTETTEQLSNNEENAFYVNGNLANGWVHHEQPVNGLYYCFYKDGLPLTGLGTDADGEHLFINGVVAQGYQTYEGVRRMYVDGKLANGWMHHVPPVNGLNYCFYKDGLPLTGLGTDGDGEHLFINGVVAQGYQTYEGVRRMYVDGKLANGWMHHVPPVNGLNYCFYKDGLPLTGLGTDGDGEHLFINGTLAQGLYSYGGVEKYYKDGKGYTGVADGKYYYQGNAANGWVHHEQPVDGLYYCFYKDGLPLTGKGTDADGEHLFINGVVAQGYQTYEGVRRMYVDGKQANGWVHHEQPVDGLYYCFYKDGQPLTGKGTDADGEHLFINGSLAQGLNEYEGIYHIYHDGKIVDETQEILEVNGIVANGWVLHDVPINGIYYFFYKNGKKLTGMGTDGNGEHLFINGLLAQGVVMVSGQERLYKDGNLESGLVDGKYYASGYLANGWVHHVPPVNGLNYCFYKDGLPLTGKGTDADGEHLFINGSLAEGLQFYNGEWRNYKGGNAVNNSIYNNAIETALSFVGKVPYVWGGASPAGFDCSGLVMYCYGIKERTTYVQQTLGTHRYDIWNAPAGALYFWGTDSLPDHVGIALGNGNYVHAATPSDGIILSNINYFSPNYYIVIGQ